MAIWYNLTTMPETTTKHLLPYPTPTDFVDVAGDIRRLAQKIDTSVDSIIQTVTGAMVSGNTETGIDVGYNSSTRKLNFVLDIPYIQDQMKDVFVHTLHTNLSVTYNDQTNQMIFAAQAGGGGGGTGSASLTDIWWLGV
jgi:hypothetical protein